MGSEMCIRDRSESGSSYSISSNSQNQAKKKRWGKKEDVQLFKVFRNFEEEGVISLREIMNSTSCSEAYNSKGIFKIIQALDCHQGPKFIWKRIKSKMSDSFSVRETKILKRELKKYHYEDISYPTVLEYFPGKSLYGLKFACDLLCSSKKLKKLDQITSIDPLLPFSASNGEN